MKNKVIVVILFFCCSFGFAQVDSSAQRTIAWKKILSTGNFSLTKNIKKIPQSVLKQMEVDTLSEITRYMFRWKPGCEGREPGMKLNWLATDHDHIIVCYSEGGYSIKSYYQFISPDTTLNTEVDISGFKHYSFKKFRKKYLEDKLGDGVIRARF